jgi:hypothetical protein
LYVLDAETIPLIICILDERLGPERITKPLKSGALRLEIEFASSPEYVKETCS